MAPTALASRLAELATEKTDRPRVLVGRAAFARLLHSFLPSFVLVEQRLAPRRLARRHGDIPALCAVASSLPFATAGIGTLIEIHTLERGDPEKLVASWRRHLVGGGRLILVETPRSSTRQALYSLGRGLKGFAPEDLTALLLNAGFTEIAQYWPPGKSMITVGRARLHPQ